LRHPKLTRNLFLYLGGMIAIIGIRRGDFKNYTTMKELLDGTEDQLQWRDPELPFFRAAGPRGRTLTLEPMSSKSARAFLHKTAAAIGMDGDEHGASPYSFRTNFATVLKKSEGLDVAAKAMAHRAGSKTICESYDVGNRSLDFFGIATGEGVVANVEAGRTPAIYAAPVEVQPLDLIGLVERTPEIAILLKQAQNLKSYMELGAGDGWQDLIVRALFH
ncbi:hypothetical protein C8R45DRAFT_814585, partial [Mycena sanguinolenta]